MGNIKIFPVFAGWQAVRRSRRKIYSLTPGAYVGVAAVEDDGVDFAERMTEIHQEMLKLQAESNELMQTISKNLEEMGAMMWTKAKIGRLL